MFPPRVEWRGHTFTRYESGVSFPGQPNAIRIQADRELTDAEVQHFAQILGYSLRSTLATEPLAQPERDTLFSFIVSIDTTKSRRDDVGLAFEEFHDRLPGMVRDGSPIRTTNRSGPGTAGTRLVGGFGSKAPSFALYYDDVNESGPIRLDPFHSMFHPLSADPEPPRGGWHSP